MHSISIAIDELFALISNIGLSYAFTVRVTS
jgi:hypothetical protein